MGLTRNLVTRRLTMRPSDPDDLEDLISLHSDPQVMLGRIGSPTPETRGQTEAWLRRNLATAHSDGRGLFRVGDRRTDEFIGRAGIRPEAGTGEDEIFYALCSDRWGRGLGTEVGRALTDHAFRSGLRRLVGVVLVTNIASQRILLGLGFKFVEEHWDAEGCHVFRYEWKV